MWIKTRKEQDQEIEDILNGKTGQVYTDVDMIAGPDKDRFLTDLRGVYEPIAWFETYALVKLPKDFKCEGYNITIAHVKRFQKN